MKQTRNELQRIINKIEYYSLFELELLNGGIISRAENLQRSNTNYENTKELVLLSQANRIIVNQIDYLYSEGMSELYEY